jgi:carboxylesterase type B
VLLCFSSVSPFSLYAQENIAAFGGDPTKVTVWGQSAGAMSTGLQLIAYGGRDDSLFRGAICDSGAPALVAPPDPSVSQKNFDSILNITGCLSSQDKIGCLRGVPGDLYEKAVNSSAGLYSPVIDGTLIPTYPSDLVKEGNFVKVPLLIGANHDEGTNLIGNPPPSPYSNETTFENYITGIVHNASQIEYALQMFGSLYPNVPAIGIPHTFHGVPNATYGAQYKRVAAVAGDITIHRGRRLSAQAWTQQNVPVYSYYFDAWPIAGQPDISGTTHFTEIELVFDNEAGNGYVLPWWTRGSEFAGDGKALIPLARLMSKK